MRSYRCSLPSSWVRIDMNENTAETVKSNATKEVSSSISDEAVLLLRCKAVITNKQKPNKLAAVLRICCEVLLAIFIK